MKEGHVFIVADGPPRSGIAEVHHEVGECCPRRLIGGTALNPSDPVLRQQSPPSLLCADDCPHVAPSKASALTTAAIEFFQLTSFL